LPDDVIVHHEVFLDMVQSVKEDLGKSPISP
jgi:hypothetical protein